MSQASAQFSLEAGARIGKASFYVEEYSYSPSSTRVEYYDLKFGQSFGIDCNIAYDFHSGIGFYSGITLDYCLSADGLSHPGHYVWDVPDDQIPHFSPDFTEQQLQDYHAFVQEHEHWEDLPPKFWNSHITYLSVPVSVRYTERLTPWLSLRPNVGVSNSFPISKKTYDPGVGYYGVSYRRYVPAAIGGCDLVLFSHWVLGAQLRYDLCHVARPCDYDADGDNLFGEQLRTRMFSIKLAYRIF